MAPFPLLPLDNRVIIKDEETPSLTRGGLHLPDRAKQQPTWGLVLAVGACYWPDGSVREAPVHVGDRVLFGEYCGGVVTYEGHDYRILGLGEIAVIDTRSRGALELIGANSSGTCATL